MPVTIFTPEDFEETADGKPKGRVEETEDDVELPGFNEEADEDEQEEQEDGEEEAEEEDTEANEPAQRSAPAAQPVSILNQRLDSDDIPPEFRGKTVSETLQLLATAKNLLQMQAQGGHQQQQQQVDETEPEFTEDDFGVGADPARFQQKLEQFAARRNAPMVVQLYRLQSDNNYMRAKSELPYFKQFEQQIMSTVNSLTVDKTANYAVWKGIHDTFVAQNVDQLTPRAAKPTPTSTVRGDSVPARGSRNKPKLSAKEKSVARGLGVSDEAYIKMRDGR